MGKRNFRMAEPSNKWDTSFENLGRRLDQGLGTAMPRIQEEARRVVSYLNDEVVPHFRQDSSQVLRSAAEQLRKLADYMDANRPGGDR